MEAIVENCAGLDVHQGTVVACVLRAPLDARPRPQSRTFGTTTDELLELADWLRGQEVTSVAMESTGVFWRQVWNILEGCDFDLILGNPRQVKNVPGRKTDQRDAEWLAQLLRCGLVRRSFVPAVEQRDLRDLTRRRRRLLQEMSAEKNRAHKALQDANVTLTSVVSDIIGVSGRALISALGTGAEFNAEQVHAMVKANLRSKVPALMAAINGRIRPHHLKMIGFSLEHIDFLQRQVEGIEEEIEVRIAPFREARELICTIPGVKKGAATEILAEIGPDMSVFHSDAHLASWAGISPRTGCSSPSAWVLTTGTSTTCSTSRGRRWRGSTPPWSRGK